MEKRNKRLGKEGAMKKCGVCRDVKIASGDEMCVACRRDYGRVRHLTDSLQAHKGNIKTLPENPTKHAQDKYKVREWKKVQKMIRSANRRAKANE